MKQSTRQTLGVIRGVPSLNFLLRLLPLLVGFGVGYAVLTNLTQYSRLVQFFVATLCALCLGYSFAQFNIWTIRREGKIVPAADPKQHLLGHLLMFVTAFVMGYGFAVRSTVVLILGAVLWWIADGKLTMGRLGGRKQPQPMSGEADMESVDPAERALINAINERRATDPLIGIKLGGREVLQRLVVATRTEHGVHIESLLCALGALAGYSCQASLRADALAKGLAKTAALLTVETTSGDKYYFGDPLNQRLYESDASVWSLVAAAAVHNGCKDLPDIKPIFAYVAATVGHPNFGVLRVPENHKPSDTPLGFLKALWPIVGPLAKKFCQAPAEWPILFAVAAQEAIYMSKEMLAPQTALLIVMESAVSMSKVELEISKPSVKTCERPIS